MFLRKLFIEGTAAYTAAVGLWAAASPIHAQDNRGGVVLVLKDPTPRSPELEKLYPSPPPKPGVDPRLSVFNQRRFTLISHAADQIVSLAAVLKGSMANVAANASFAPQGQVAGAIAGLAGNIYGALTTGTATAATPPHLDQLADRAQITAAVSELFTLSESLKVEVAKSDPNALPAGVILKAARVRQLAQSLHDRMQHP